MEGDHVESPASDPPAGDALDMESILPEGDEALGTAKLVQTEYSPELERILTAAAERLSAELRPSSPPSNEDAIDLVLPPEILASLDEPLDPEEEDQGTGSGLGTGGSPIVGTGGTAQRTGSHTSTQAIKNATDARVSEEQRTEARGSEPMVTRQRTTPTPLSYTGVETALLHEPLSAPFQPMPHSGFPSDPVPARPPQESAVPSRSTQQPFTVRGDFVAVPSSLAASRLFSDASSRPIEPELPRHAPPPLAAPSFDPAPRSIANTSTSAGLPAELFVTGPPRPEIPAVLGEGDAVRALAHAIAARATGSLALNTDRGLRRIVLQDGDILTAGSAVADETLLAFLAARGDIERETAARLGGKLPPFGRHAGAALIAHGHMGQEDLWPVLRAHAEWIIGRAVSEESGTCELEPEAPGRFKAEPSVFGGATGAEVFVETLRRVVPASVAARRLGGMLTRLDEGPRRSILGECALRREEEDAVRGAPAKTIGEVVAESETELVTVVYACVALEILATLAPVGREDIREPGVDPLDEEAIRQRVRARLALVEDGDYFALLGVSRSATGYEIRRAFVELRRGFEPSRLLTAQTADLAEDLRLILEVVDEAYEILKEPHRRERYRRAIEAGPP
jgi:hypothetical protein